MIKPYNRLIREPCERPRLRWCAAMAIVVLGLGVLGGGALAAAASVVARRQHAYAPGTHAPRDDARRDPLGRALRHGYGGVEVAARLSTSSNDGDERLLIGASEAATDAYTTV